jgi:hypothetical protein
VFGLNATAGNRFCSMEPLALLRGAAALVAMLRFKLGLGWTLLGSTVLGGLRRLAQGSGTWCRPTRQLPADFGRGIASLAASHLQAAQASGVSAAGAAPDSPLPCPVFVFHKILLSN